MTTTTRPPNIPAARSRLRREQAEERQRQREAELERLLADEEAVKRLSPRRWQALDKALRQARG